MAGDRIHQGGLMRCCVESLINDPQYGKGKEGDRTECRWCKDGIVFKDGAWRWVGPKDAVHDLDKR